MKTYKDLKVWQNNQNVLKLAMELQKQLPKHFAFEHIWRQLFRAITSVGANLAEGQQSYEGKEFNRYINIAIRSSIEVDYWMTTISDLLSEEIPIIDEVQSGNIEVIKMLKGLRNSLASN